MDENREPAALDELFENQPDGMKVVRNDDDHFVVHYRRTGMGCMNAFIIFWLTGWTVGCPFVVKGYLTGEMKLNGSDIPLWFVFIFLGAEVFVAAFLAHLLFTRKTFAFDPVSLTIMTNTLGYKRRKVISKGSIETIEQVQDGGEGEDSFSSCGVSVQAGRKTTLIFRQPFEKTAWFGSVISEWSGAWYRKLDPPTKR